MDVLLILPVNSVLLISSFVETIRNATEEVIRKYVKNQLIELDRKEINSDQLDLF
jgi:putative transposase